MWAEPDWETVWTERRERSELVEKSSGIDIYRDPVTSRRFKYDRGSGESEWMPDLL